MKILHTGDIHIRMGQDTRYRKDLFQILRFIVDTVTQTQANYVFIAGDLFDTKMPTPLETAVAAAFLRRLLDTGTQVVITVGNHDLQAVRNASHTLSAIENLKVHNLHIMSEVSILNQDNISIVSLPYTYFDKEQALEKFSHLCNMSENTFTIIHGWVEEYMPIVAQREFVIKKEFLDSLKKVKYHALGHIHLGGQVLPNAMYSGSPFRITMGEQEKEKFLVMWDDGNIYRIITPAYPIKNIDIKNVPDLTGLKDHICRIQAKNITVEDTLKIDQLKQQLEKQGNFVYTDIEFQTVQFASTQESKRQTFDEYKADYIKKNNLVEQKAIISSVLDRIISGEINENTSVFDLKELK